MWRRGLAFLIDLTPLFVLVFLQNILGIANSEVVGLINFVLLLGYFAGMDYRYGGTLGKRLVGLRVALPASPNVVGQLIGRAFIKIICLFPPLAVVYGLIAIWRPDGRSLADFVAGSAVVDAFTLAPPPQQSLGGKILASILILVGPFLFMIMIMVVMLGVALAINWEELLPFLSAFMEQ